MSIYAVNGKVPVAAWIPSRDTAGNGTTTLTDLVGTNHGTLTNMDAATDWVADTGAGGVRALDFDKSNDYIIFGNIAQSVFSVTFWFNSTTGGAFNRILNQDGFRFEIGLVSSKLGVFYGTSWQTFGATTFATNSWNHGTITYNTTSVEAFQNGISLGSIVGGRSLSGVSRIGGVPSLAANDMFGGRLDDIRIFNTALTASDVAWLYNGGNGRGRIQGNLFQMGQPI